MDGGTFDFLDGALLVGIVDGSLVQDGGTLNSGEWNSMRIDISGDYQLNAGTAVFRLGGTASFTYDRILINAGTLGLGPASELDVTLIDSFVPVLGDSFDLFDFQTLAGSFGSINLPDLTPGLGWDTSQLLVDGTLSVIAAFIPGDTDDDGDIDDADLGTAFANYTGPLSPGTGNKTAADGDTDSDGDVDDADLGTAFSGYSGPLATTVPEPSVFALLTLGGLLVCRRQRGRS